MAENRCLEYDAEHASCYRARKTSKVCARAIQENDTFGRRGARRLLDGLVLYRARDSFRGGVAFNCAKQMCAVVVIVLMRLILALCVQNCNNEWR